MAASRSTIRRCGTPPIPCSMSSMMAPGSSVRGLSEVAIARSAASAAIRPMSGRLPLSRSPPQPNTTMSRPRVSGRSVASARSSASGVWA